VRVLTILGTRPEIIRLSRIISKLDAVSEHRIIHTGQNYDPNLDRIFFEELSVRQPDFNLGARGTFGEQMGTILAGVEKIVAKFRPDRFLVLGDTNSSLGAIIVKREGVPVYHMEAGNRCYDDRVPEEVNRRIIDHSSDVLLPYTERSRQNLLAEGIPGWRIFVTGNPIYEVLKHYEVSIEASTVLDRLELQPHRYFLVTMHRAENVDVEDRLRTFVEAFHQLHSDYSYPVVVSTHPLTRKRMAALGISSSSGADVRFMEPFGFFDFVKLEKNAFCLLSDSGTVQEEATILGIPNVTIRDATERPETLECGSNMLTGAVLNSIIFAVKEATQAPQPWLPPTEYVRANVSTTVLRILSSELHPSI